jgi:LmbE family N-acetylglucosaminyl deacetylase
MNILAIGAHFDDIELGCGGTLARHVAQGDKVYGFVATVSGFMNPDNQVVRGNEVAMDEGRKAMAVLGVELTCGWFRTLEVEFNEALNGQIIRLVEEKKIDRVYTHWIGDIHHDHQAVARASLHSCRHVPRVLMYRSNWYHSASEFRGTYYVDVTDFLDKKFEALRMHDSEMSRTHEKWITFFRNEAESAGQRIGVPFAEVFELVKWLEA